MVNIKSSYRRNSIGETFYKIVLKYKPISVIEFGVLYGYSTIYMAKALKKLGRGKIQAYDLWEKYTYRHTSINVAQKNLEQFGVLDIITLKQKNFYDWLETPEKFDFLHIDISNDGEVIEYAYNKLKSLVGKKL